ncbi:DnaB-like helicase C-terminal domain-containing protein [Streptomyces californicus]|uniref:DnaB-like helicase C-terminal domain-containing protein n=1 Tax=Streptomyces californicus TaxID=67351 RepID=UPI0033D01418
MRAALFRQEGAVLYVSYGASSQDIAARVLAGHLRIGYRAVREGRLEGDERAAVDELAAGPQAARLLIEDRPRAGAGELTRLARDLRELRLVVVDGLKTQPGPDLPAQELRRLARDLDVPVLAVAEPGDGEGLRAALAPDVEIALVLAEGGTGYGTRGDRARVTECDLGLSTGAAVRTDLERARLVGPRFDAVGVFGTDEGKRAVDALKSAAHDLLEAPGALPEGLGKRLGQLRKGMPETFSGMRFGDIPDQAQRAVLQEWAARPPLPQTEAGRRLATALDAFYAHAVAHGYDPEAEIPHEP